MADRLHNIRTISYLPEERRKVFAKETVDLFAPLADRLGIYWIRTELEDKCFEVLKPNEYKEITKIFNHKKDEWENSSIDKSPFVRKLSWCCSKCDFKPLRISIVFIGR